MKEVKEKLASLEVTSDKLEPVCLVLKSEVHTPLSDLMKQLDKHVKSLELIQVGLKDIDVGSRTPDRAQQDKNLLSVIYGGRKHDKVQDQPNFQDGKLIQNGATFQDEDSDGDNPYAEIDNLRKQILQSRHSPSSESVSLVPGPQSGGRPMSISGHMFTLPGHTGMNTMTGIGLYERVEELIPSPFVDHDMVCNGYSLGWLDHQ